MAELYLVSGTILIAGFVWFWIVRPIAVSARDAYQGWRADREPPAPRRLTHGARRTRPALPIRVMLRSERMTRTHAPQGGVARAPATALPGVLVRGNAGNELLPGNVGNAVLPDAARDIIRMQVHAEDVVELLASKTMGNKAAAIELIFKCKRSGRPNSTYQQALILVDALLTRYPQRTEEQEANRKELELSRSA